MTEKNHYETLGVSRDATPEQIKKNYRKLARQYHPDISKEADAEARMQTVNVAYDTLSNPEKKAEYDAMLDNPQGFNGRGFGQGGFGQGGFDGRDFGGYAGGTRGDFSGFEDLFGRFGAGFGGGRASSGFGRDPRDTGPYRGEDQHAAIEVEVDVAYHGATQQVVLQVPTYTAQGQPEVQRKTLQIRIPAGMKEDQQIRLAGQGQAGLNGGAPGDLYIEIRYRHQPRLYVEGADVHLTVDIMPWQASLGGPLEVTTPAGRLQISIPKAARNGQQLRLKGKGIPNSTESGHLYITLNLVAPAAQTDAQRQAYEQLASAFATL